jgi:Domain of unknown function (DUF4276)
MSIPIAVLLEGASDAPAVRELLQRKFNLIQGTHFSVHDHNGRGKLPNDILGHPAPNKNGLLDLLPAKLRGMCHRALVLVVLDADDDNPADLICALESMRERLQKKPQNVIFCLAIEETESWFIADHKALLKAYPKADLKAIRKIQPDAVVGAWEHLADALKIRRTEVTGGMKYDWATVIAPHLELNPPPSPSLNALVNVLTRQIPICLDLSK